jgi:tRNA(fMet)-specific endonuclease VapC
MMIILPIRWIGSKMTVYILDTDHISLFLGNYSSVRDRVLKTKADCSITIISVQEIFNGWVGQLNRVENEAYKIEIYQRLNLTTQFIQIMPVLNYEQAASVQYQQLIQANPLLSKRRLEKDMRIAAIALAHKATIVTRNKRDFEQVPNLTIEDWS